MTKRPWNKGLTKKTHPTLARFSKERKGKSMEELYGYEKARDMSIKLRKALKGGTAWNKDLTKETDERVAKYAKSMRGRRSPLKGKTYEEIYGIERAKRKRKEISERQTGSVGWSHGLTKETHPSLARPTLKGKTLEEIVGPEKAREIKKGRSLMMSLRNKRFGNPSTEEDVKRKIREKMKKYCESEGVRESLRERAKLIVKKPTLPERRFIGLIERYGLPFKYVGNFSLWIGDPKKKKNPDFIHNNGEQKVIEVYGNYWHRGQDPDDDINFYKRYGYDCLVIWEHELQKGKEKDLVRKINLFEER